MTCIENILISVEGSYVKAILEGQKTVELRRRALGIGAGSLVWIYSKLPRGSVELVCETAKVVAAPPAQLWRMYRSRVAIAHADFQEYFRGTDKGHAIVFGRIWALEPAVGLNALRALFKAFHPPQFFKKLTHDSEELMYFKSASKLQQLARSESTSVRTAQTKTAGCRALCHSCNERVS
jgi:predicted transcriptional regulator